MVLLAPDLGSALGGRLHGEGDPAAHLVAGCNRGQVVVSAAVQVLSYPKRRGDGRVPGVRDVANHVLVVENEGEARVCVDAGRHRDSLTGPQDRCLRQPAADQPGQVDVESAETCSSAAEAARDDVERRDLDGRHDVVGELVEANGGRKGGEVARHPHPASSIVSGVR